MKYINSFNTWTKSKISIFSTCPYQFYLRYIRGVVLNRKKTPEQVINIALHKLVANAIEENIPNITIDALPLTVRKRVLKIIDEKTLTGMAQVIKDYAIRNYIERDCKSKYGCAMDVDVRLEWFIYGKQTTNNLTMRWMSDLIYIRPKKKDGIVEVVKYIYSPELDKSIDMYKEELEYALTILKMKCWFAPPTERFNPTKGIIHLWQIDQKKRLVVESKEYDKEQLMIAISSMTNKLRDMEQMLRKKEFPKRIGAWCDVCPYYKICNE